MDEMTKPKMTTLKAFIEMQVCVHLADEFGGGDPERAHLLADEILLARLSQLGETSLVHEFRKVKKWYA